MILSFCKENIAEALEAADARQDYAERVRLPNYDGRELTPELERENHHVGAIAEWACALHFGLTFNASVGDLTACDLGIIEVRGRRDGPNADLPMRRNDTPKLRKPFVLVLVNLIHLTANIVGWLCGWEAMKRADNATQRYGVWYIPPPYHSVRSLEQWIMCGHPQHWCPS